MKNLIKELAKREGLKSQVKVGNLRETVSKLQDILAEEVVEQILIESPGGDDMLAEEFLTALGKKVNSILKKKKSKYFVEKIIMDIHGTLLPVKTKKQ